MAIIRISQAGSCPRRLQLEAYGVQGLPLTDYTLRAFAEGRVHEPDILEWAAQNLPGAPYILSDQQKEVTLTDDEENLITVGHIDAIGSNQGESVILEAKCLAARSFQELREKGVKEAYPQYYTQVQLYLAAAHLNRAYLVARNKDTPKTRMWDMHFEGITHDPVFVSAEIMRIKELIKKIKAHEDIDPPYSPDTSWHCKPAWCPYTYVCHPGYSKPKPETVYRSDLLATVETLQELNEQIKEFETLRDEIKAKLMEEAADKPIQSGKWIVQTVERRSERLDTAAARRELPADILAKLIKISTYKILDIKEVE